MSIRRQSERFRDEVGSTIPRRGLAARLTWAFILLAGALLLIVGIVLSVVSFNAQREQVAIRQQKTAGEAALVTSAYLSQALNTLSVYGNVGSLSGLLMKSFAIQDAEVNSILSEYPDVFQSVTLLDAAGDELAKTSRFRQFTARELGSQKDNPAYLDALLGLDYIDDEIRMADAGMFPSIAVGVPVKGRDVPGALLAEVSIESMWDAMAEVEVGETGYAYIVDRESGELVAHSDLDRYLQSEGLDLSDVLIVGQLKANEADLATSYVGLDGKQVMGAAEPVPGTNWALIVELPTSEAMADVNRMLLLLAALIVAGVLVAGSLGLIIPRRILQPLGALQEGAREIGAGNLDQVIEVHTDDEMEDLADAFNDMAASLKASHDDLEGWGHELEERVEQRTNELAEATERMRRRAVQIQASAEVAGTIASVRDLDRLLTQVTEHISERFGWYHVGIFLLDEPGEYAVLEAANSAGGKRMLARGHRLRVGEQGIVGSVTGTGYPLIALDVGDEAVYFDNPDMPGTRSEMALPLKVGGRIIGALDVQSLEAQAYDDEDVAVSNILADQVAIAIENVRLFEQTQRALEEVESLHRQYVQREWAKEAAGQETLGYEYRQRGMPSLAEIALPEVEMALARGDVVAVDDYSRLLDGLDTNGDDGEDEQALRQTRAAIAAPIKIRDQVIGVLDLQEVEDERDWSEDDVVLVQAISDQVGQALETARLFEETSRRAEQMSTLNRIGLDLAAGLELERVLQSLYEQCQQVLITDTFYVALYDEATGTISFPLLTGAEGPIQVDPIDIRYESGFTGYVIKTGQQLHVADTHAVPEDAAYHALEISDMPNRSYLGAPLTARGRIIGVLSVQGRDPNAYEKEDAELLATIGTQASIAIENASAYERLVETADELRELDKLKMQFLANMSHELRTPLNSIIGFARVMLKGIDGPLTDLQEADLTSIYNSGQHLLSLINSILDMSKIEAGKMDLIFDEISLPDVIDGAVSVAKALVKDSPADLLSVVPDNLPTVWADAQRVRQVLLNLLSNAAKFTEEGSIVLRAETGNEFITISVEDTGAGIEPEAQESIFLAFQQADGSTTRRAEGTGLGLAISRSFVELHGGELWVESTLGQGSTFYFTLPIFQPAIEDEQEVLAKGIDHDKRMILAVDDDSGVITLLKRYLEGGGYQVIGVTRSRQALEAAQRLAPNLAAITLDIVMPEPDGWQVLRSLKEDPRTQDIPVVLCSIIDDLEQGLALGAQACLKKPVTRDEVLQVLERLEPQGSGNPGG